MKKHFVADSMLGRLSKWLRVLGFDTRYERLAHQEQLDNFKKGGFLIITRNHRWCGQDMVLHLKANDPMAQLLELIPQAGISEDEIQPLCRCVPCNTLLEVIHREEVFGRVPDYVYETHFRFFHCANCHRVYWRGSHITHMIDRLRLQTGWSI